METAKRTIGALFGLSPIETDILIDNTKQRVLPVIITIARVLFALSFLYCLVCYTAIGIVTLVLTYYIIQLERKVDSLERKIKESNNQQWLC